MADDPTLIDPADALVVTHLIAAGGRRVPVYHPAYYMAMMGESEMWLDDLDRPDAPFLPVGVVMDVYRDGAKRATVTVPTIAGRTKP